MMTVGELMRILADLDPTLEVHMDIRNKHTAPAGQVYTQTNRDGKTVVFIDDYMHWPHGKRN